MQQKKLSIKNKTLQKRIKTEERKDLKKDFFELLRRAATHNLKS
ncbi:MAG TPA: hypothetical protein VLF20_02230 [Patescibacteria group bacterium]|nr:hypothetical protein [Patescibacteria group bacterium]